jgi:hypothetical protein
VNRQRSRCREATSAPMLGPIVHRNVPTSIRLCSCATAVFANSATDATDIAASMNLNI